MPVHEPLPWFGPHILASHGQWTVPSFPCQLADRRCCGNCCIVHLRRRRRLIPLVNDTGALLCDVTFHLMIQPLKPVDCTRAKRKTCFLRRRCKLWFMTSLGSLIELVGFFDIAARLRSGDRPIAALVGRAIDTVRVSYVIPNTASIMTVKIMC